MIKIDFVFAIASFLCLSIGGFFIQWLYSGIRRHHAERMDDHIKLMRQCPYCTHLFFNYQQTSLMICPRCKSYIDREPEKIHVKGS